jgi:hypothetical protein
VIYRPTRGLVALSAASGRVLKILHGADEAVQIAHEESVAVFAHRLMPSPLIPRFFKSGKCDDDTQWTFTELAPNTRPLLMPRLFPLGSAHRFRMSALATFLFELYKASSWELSPNEQWFGILEKLVHETKNPTVFTRLLIHARHAMRQAPKSGAVFSLIHADLKIEHIHRSDTGCFVIDWGMASRGPIIIDWFWELLMLRLPFYYGPITDAFIAWLMGTRSNPPGIISRNLEEFFALVKRELGVHVPRGAWRFQVLAATIHLHCLRDALLGVSPRPIARLL